MDEVQDEVQKNRETERQNCFERLEQNRRGELFMYEQPLPALSADEAQIEWSIDPSSIQKAIAIINSMNDQDLQDFAGKRFGMSIDHENTNPAKPQTTMRFRCLGRKENVDTLSIALNEIMERAKQKVEPEKGRFADYYINTRNALTHTLRTLVDNNKTPQNVRIEYLKFSDYNLSISTKNLGASTFRVRSENDIMNFNLLLQRACDTQRRRVGKEDFEPNYAKFGDKDFDRKLRLAAATQRLALMPSDERTQAISALSDQHRDNLLLSYGQDLKTICQIDGDEESEKLLLTTRQIAINEAREQARLAIPPKKKLLDKLPFFGKRKRGTEAGDEV